MGRRERGRGEKEGGKRRRGEEEKRREEGRGGYPKLALSSSTSPNALNTASSFADLVPLNNEEVPEEKEGRKEGIT